MKRYMNNLMVAFLFASSSPHLLASDGPHWGYEGENGPAHWAELSDKFALCGTGKNQSPVNLSNFTQAQLAPIDLNYKAGAADLLNNGHTVQVNYAPGSSLSVNEHAFSLKQFHFHAPSENQLNGKNYALEAHFVHADAAGNLAVLAVFFDVGESNPELGDLWQFMPMEAEQSQTLAEPFNGNDLLPESLDYYRFSGSLTTPPCSEGVTWLVLKQVSHISSAQLAEFKQAVKHDNNRPVQPLYARTVLQ